MRPAILSLLAVTKLAVCALAAMVALPDLKVRVEPVPATMVEMSEPASGGYRRKPDDVTGRP